MPAILAATPRRFSLCTPLRRYCFRYDVSRLAEALLMLPPCEDSFFRAFHAAPHATFTPPSYTLKASADAAAAALLPIFFAISARYAERCRYAA